MDISIIEDKLRESGYKLTEQRKIVIEALQHFSTPCTAQQVYEYAKEKCDINFSTVYRNLELLSKMNIVSKLSIKEGVAHFEIITAEHQHHIICKCCGDMKVIDICPYKNVSADVLEKLGFMATEHKFEIYGYCNKCSNDKDNNN